MAEQLLCKKTIAKLGTTLKENGGGTTYSSFARRQMEKMGWTEGKGLGRNEDGITNHIKVKKKDENEGLGSKEENTQVKEDWWQDSFSQNLATFQTKQKRKRSGNDDLDSQSKEKKRKNKKKDKKDKSDPEIVPLNFEVKMEKEKKKKDRKQNVSLDELFHATGGVRLGMRARASQIGKLKRTGDN